MRRTWLGALVLLLALPINARANGDLSAGGGYYRCAFGNGRVPGGTAEIFVCSDLGTGPDVTMPWIDAPYFWVGLPMPVTGYVSISTTKGSDGRYFYFNPFEPNPEVLTTFTMDPAMGTAQLTINIGTMRANVTLTGTGSIEPRQGMRFVQDEATDLVFCIFAGAGASLYRRSTLSGSITSTRVGGGALSTISASMVQGASAGGHFSLVPEEGWYVIC